MKTASRYAFPQHAALIICRLEDAIAEARLSDDYLKYFSHASSIADDCEVSLLNYVLTADTGLSSEELVLIAYGHWESMPDPIRLGVIDRFVNEFRYELSGFNLQQKSLIFCRIFLYELIPLIVSVLD